MNLGPENQDIITVGKFAIGVPPEFKGRRNARLAFERGACEAAEGGDWTQFNPYKKTGGSFHAFMLGGNAYDEKARPA